MAERQQTSRGELARELKGILDREISTLKQQRGTALAMQRESFTKERAALIDTQTAERTKMREAWRQVYERRGKDPRYQARQSAAPSPEQKPMRDQFEKNRRQRPTIAPAPTVERTLSTPAPAPSPAGVPPLPAKARQSVPQVDRAAEWAKTPEGRESLAKTAPAPAVRKDFDRSAEQAAAPQSRAEKWNERAKEISTERKTSPLDRSIEILTAKDEARRWSTEQKLQTECVMRRSIIDEYIREVHLKGSARRQPCGIVAFGSVEMPVDLCDAIHGRSLIIRHGTDAIVFRPSVFGRLDVHENGAIHLDG